MQTLCSEGWEIKLNIICKYMHSHEIYYGYKHAYKSQVYDEVIDP